MEKGFREIKTFAFLTISFFILVFTAYLHYTELSQVAFLSSDFSFEKSDEGNRPSDDANELRIIASAALFTMLFQEIPLLDRSCHFFSLSPSFPEETFVLRC